MTYSAHGTLLKRGNGATPTETFTTLGEVRDIDGPQLKQIMKDITNHSSGGFEQYKPMLLSMGQVKFTVAFDPAGATHSYTAGLVQDWYNKTLRNFKVLFTDLATTTWAFSAYVEQVSMKMPVKGDLTADVVLTISGTPTLA